MKERPPCPTGEALRGPPCQVISGPKLMVLDPSLALAPRRNYRRPLLKSSVVQTLSNMFSKENSTGWCEVTEETGEKNR